MEIDTISKVNMFIAKKMLPDHKVLGYRNTELSMYTYFVVPTSVFRREAVHDLIVLEKFDNFQVAQIIKFLDNLRVEEKK